MIAGMSMTQHYEIMIPEKKCNCCGAVHTVAPKNSQLDHSGLWFNCSCRSTLLVKIEDLTFEADRTFSLKPNPSKHRS